MGRPAVGLEISDADCAALHQFVRTGIKSARARTRARILLLSAERQAIATIATTLQRLCGHRAERPSALP